MRNRNKSLHMCKSSSYSKESNPKVIIFILLLISLITLNSFRGEAVTGFTIDQDMVYAGTSSSINTVYQDGIAPNSDVGIELCTIGAGQYVGGFYAAKIDGAWQSALVTYNSESEALSPASVANGGCFDTSPATMTVSPSELTGPNPQVRKAAFPGKLFIGYAATANPGSPTDYLPSGTNAQLLGQYNQVYPSFSQSTRRVALSAFQIQFQASGTTVLKTVTDATHGLSSERRMAIGLCDISDGTSCSDGSIYTSNVFPLSLDTDLGAGAVNDQNTYTRYIVINGLSTTFCIGANLAGSVSATPNPVYYSQTLNITPTITNPSSIGDANGGNVDVTTNFRVRVNISNASGVHYSTIVNVTSDIAAAASSVLSIIQWPAYLRSGTYTITVVADIDNSVIECREDDNTFTTSFVLLPITLPNIYIDGDLTNTFDYPNVPYNMSFYFKNSDNDTLRNATVIMIENNGLNLAAPTQIYNRSINPSGTVKAGIISESRATMITDYYGNVSFTYIPTYNNLYQADYNYLDLSNYIGNYSIYLTGTQSNGQAFAFIQAGQALSANYTFNFSSYSHTGDYPNKVLKNQNMASQVYDLIYHTFSHFIDTLVG